MELYREVRCIDRHGKVWLVYDVIDNLHVRKRLSPEELDIYTRLSKIRAEGMPEIELIYSEDGADYLIEEYIDGWTLEELLESGKRFSVKEVRDIVKSLCETLAPIHRRGIVHRDITASNVMLSQSGEVYLIDFGNSRIHKRKQKRDTEFIGTRDYAAPEQYGFGQSDRRTDIYSIGVLMNVLLTGGRFLHEETHSGLLTRAIKRCTAVKPKDRYRSVRALRRAMTSLKRRIFVNIPCGVYFIILVPVIALGVYMANSPEGPEQAAMQIESLTGGNDIDPPDVRKRTTEELIRNGRYDEAVAYLDSIAEKGLQGYLEITLYSQCYEAQGRYDEAASVLIDYLYAQDAKGLVGTVLLTHENSFTPWLARLYPGCSDEVKRRIDALPTPGPD